MKITALDTYCLSAPLPQSVRTSNSTISQVSEVIVKLTTDVGWWASARPMARSCFVILESFADPTRDPLWFELFRQRPEIVDGFMAVPEAPGLGLELRDDTLEKYGVRIE